MSDPWTAAVKATQSFLCWCYQELGDSGGGGGLGEMRGSRKARRSHPSQGTGQVCREKGTDGRCQQVRAAGLGG